MSSFFSSLWKKIYKEPVRRLKEERLLKSRLAFAMSIARPAAAFDKEIVIIRTDDIGDYILFRNTLEFLKRSRPGYKITIIGHVLWKDMSESWDAEFVDEFIWLQKGRFNKEENYVKEFLAGLSSKKPEILLAPSYSRNPFIDDIITALIPAKEKYAFKRSDRERKSWLRKYVDHPYTHLAPIDEIHESLQNIRFMETVTGKKYPFEKIFIDKNKLPAINIIPPYIVLFPGAAAKQKRWSAQNFAKTADYISEKYSIKCFVCGSAGDKHLFEEIKNHSKHKNNFIDYTGKTSLGGLAAVINHCQLIITNDTSAAHIAAALEKNTVVIYNGNSYGRFLPYPANSYPTVKTVTPAPGNTHFDWEGSMDIQKIKTETVLKQVDMVLRKD